MNIFPMIHLNGTGKTSLQSEYREALKALHQAQEALQKATCHPRDFYPYEDPDAFEKARAWRADQHHKLHEVEAYLTAHLAHFCE